MTFETGDVVVINPKLKKAEFVKLASSNSSDFIEQLWEANKKGVEIKVKTGGGSNSQLEFTLDGREYETNWHLNSTLMLASEILTKVTTVKYTGGMKLSAYTDKLKENIRKALEAKPGKTQAEQLTQKLKSLEIFNRCVLPAGTQQQIEAALTVILNAKKMEEWGVNEHFEKGITNAVLLYGPPGTGKTMVGESFAAVLNKNLSIVTTAELQSPMPGEMERNIQATFKKAKESGDVLLFDECESLLYNRNNLGSIMGAEVNTMLIELERHPGVVLFTTNNIDKLDSAVSRRIISKIRLEMPDKIAREQIWRTTFPAKTPLGEIDFSYIAEFEMAGGDIKNCVLLAIRQAVVQNTSSVEMGHILVALEQVTSSQHDLAEAQRARQARPITQEAYRGN